MTALSVRLSRALNKGRAEPQVAQTREQVLAVLLRKRAAAHAAGAGELESMLRSQISWALPMHKDDRER